MTTWTDYQKALRWHLDHNDIGSFLEWSTVQATMYVGNAPYIPFELAQIPIKDFYALENPGIGTADTSPMCTNLIHQYYHLKQWLDRTKQKLSEMSSIVEIGAGYGAMALLCRRFGFKGTYRIIDLPEPAYLQEYYLRNTVGLNEVSWASSLKSHDLCIALHSLGEIPIVERELPSAKEWLFAAFYEFEGVDNQGWFQQLAGSKMGVDWIFYPHPFYPNAFYMIGTEL